MRLNALTEGRTLVLGFGREGRALERVAATRFPSAKIELHCDQMPDPSPVCWPTHTGPLSALGFVPDRILRSPGVPVDKIELQQWRDLGVPVTCISSLWFGERPKTRVIGVTGSKGKSTTASLITHLLRTGGVSVALGGNIGVPMLDLLDTQADVFVIELSSYQLADLHGHADIGAITRLFPEHLDWHGSESAYYAAKLRLGSLLQGRPLLINGADPVLAEAVSGIDGVEAINVADTLHARDDGLWEQGRRRLVAEASPLPGRHNLDNLALAVSVAERVLDERLDLSTALAGFEPLEHRLQLLKSIEAPRCINDSIATTPHATAAALAACPGEVVLIVGGLERGGDWRLVTKAMVGRKLAGLVTLPDNGPEVAARLVDAGLVSANRVREAESMVQAVDQALELCPPCGTVLLSPGAPSFPHFRDFEDRGHQFVAAMTTAVGAG